MHRKIGCSPDLRSRAASQAGIRDLYTFHGVRLHDVIQGGKCISSKIFPKIKSGS